MTETLPFDRAEIEGSIVDRFRRVARRVPARPAVVEAASVTTYADLAEAARRISARLREELPDAPGPVALLMAPGAEVFSAMLGVLEAGRFYVPLDPALPEARLRSVWDTLDAAALISGETLRAPARELSNGRAPVWTAKESSASPSAEGSRASARPDDLAYVLFTSGSTGRPKGVMQSHRNVLHNVWKLSSSIGIRPDDRITLLASPSVGASVSDIFGALLNGAAICPHGLGGDGLGGLPDFLERQEVTIYHSVPSVFRTLSATLDGRHDVSRVRVVKLGGETVLASDFDLYRSRFSRRCVFQVGYGATEINVIRQWSAGPETPWPGGVPLGYPVDETEVVLLDSEGRETEGEGEIGIRARTLAVGYWKDPERTASAFRPVADRPGFRLYRTGDLGRLLPDGFLLHAGRTDDRVKVRGHRVEVAEVESALAAIPGVREAAAGTRPTPGGTRLAAWLVIDRRVRPSASDLRRALSAKLPAALVPTAFVFLEALPRAASGKLDRAALPDPGGARPPISTPFREPADPAEADVCAAFRDALGLDRVGADDDFFDLGGDSLSAIDALTALSVSRGSEVSAADLLEAPTPAALAARVRARIAIPEDGLVRLRDGDRRTVFVVPGGAGDREDLFAARRIAAATGAGFPFLCFRSGAPPHPALPVLARNYVARLRARAPRGPYALVGDCIGGIVALAMARLLRSEGEEVALLALLDTPFPSAGRRRRAWALRHAPRALRAIERLGYFRRRLAHHLGVLRAMPRGRAAYVLRLGRVGAKGFAPAESAARRRFLEQRASYVGSALSWTPEPYDGRILVVESDEGRAKGHAAAWRRLVPQSDVVSVPGDHTSFLVEHGRLVGDALRAALEAADQAERPRTGGSGPHLASNRFRFSWYSRK